MEDNIFPEHVVITGAGRGIGKAIALSLADKSRHILCISKSENCARTKEEITARGFNADHLLLNIENYSQAREKTFNWLEEKKASRVAVIASASVLGPPGPLLDCNMEEWQSTFAANLFGNLAVVQAALPVMEKARYGRIIMLSGGGAAYAYPYFPAYACSKAALVREVENLASDTDSKGDISAICLAPGAVETDMLAAVREAGAEIRTTSEMDDILTCVKALLGERSKLLSGRFIHVRDDWQKILSGQVNNLSGEIWKLRRIE